MYKIIDPSNKFTEQGTNYITEACGIIPHWAEVGDIYGRTFKEAFEDGYQFGPFEMKGGTVDVEGVYKYPEDPDLYPLMRLDNSTGETCFIYLYGIVAIVSEGKDTYITRMD